MHAMTMMERVRIVWMQGAGVAREQGGYRARADLQKFPSLNRDGACVSVLL